MSRNTGNKSAPPRKNISPLLTGILVGMVIGVTMAAGLAWLIMKSPSPFVQQETVIIPPQSGTKPQPGAPISDTPASGDDKPRFEFYKVLTDKQDTGTAAKPADKPQPESKPAADHAAQYLQAGSFSSADDAERLKARLALQGFEADIQTVTLPEKGVWHRVRLGPYKNAAETDKARAALKQNGIDATPIRAQ
ncbi:MAG: SPOR domain-containing protein [Methylobacter sp.]|nr:SPOR domain-containing protein [Methylobacter sp.]